MKKISMLALMASLAAAWWKSGATRRCSIISGIGPNPQSKGDDLDPTTRTDKRALISVARPDRSALSDLPSPSKLVAPAARAPSHSISAPCALLKTSGCSMTST